MKTTGSAFLCFWILFLTGCRHEEKTTAEYAAVRQVENGKPVSVVFTSYSTTLRANGTDKTLMRLTVADSLGREILSARDTIFTLPDNMGKGACIWEPFRWGETAMNRQGEVNQLLSVYDDIATKYLKQ